ncbi:S49 family peptidase [Microbulbifer sp. OS29]|uniref:S49 family peptidase n=1 Tax=Microbulbifer okhotskensis TaxID=2926617 RepID=A0A9X2EP14_9GAMM|nr:S49 family peptidase [Microbulbifer okhotskensis]MCO1333123.1 S49 family peptidase [Microbulbifer okhotskensis]
MKFWNHAAGEPWAITESALNNILTIASRQNESIEVVSAKLGRELDNSYVTEIREGAAVIPVVGPLFRYANIFTAISGASSYEILAKDFTSALENPDVHSIILDIDSPGGEVNGCAEFASMIFEARGKKPIIAYASGDAASGAYWIASACDQIIASETSMLGSIGVVAVYRGSKDESVLEIVSSQSPYKRLDPSSKDGKSRLQSRIDDLATVFIESIAKHRGVDPPTVIKDFGGGDVFIGKNAINSGLADDIGSLEQIINEHSNNQNPAKLRGSSFLALEDSTMTDKNHKTEASEGQVLSLESLKADYPQLVEAIQTETIASTNDEASQQSVITERERIGAIISSEAAKGREQLAQHLAFSTDMSADMALATLDASPVKAEASAPVSNTGFEQVMASVGNPAIEPDAPEQEGDDADAVAKRIAKFSQGGAV